MPRARLHRKQLEKAAPDGIAPRKSHHIPLVLPSSLRKCNSQVTNYVSMNGVYVRARHTTLWTKYGNSFVSVHIAIRARTAFHVEFGRTYAHCWQSRKCRLIDRAAQKYRVAWSALVSLSEDMGSGDWKERVKPLKELEPGNVRGLSDGLEGESEGSAYSRWRRGANE